jgi:uncharacterized protein (TIGR03000 family)
MKRNFFAAGRIGLALAAVITVGGSAQAQSTSTNGSRYPYWGTAPESYRGSRLNVPVPGMSPNTISNAAHGPATSGGGDSGIGGGYVPPSLTAENMTIPPRNGRTGADTKAHIWMRVPKDAEVWVEGVKTKQSGESRYFFSPPLTPGKKYSYQMRVRWTKDGKPVEETESIVVHAGATIRRDFTASGDTRTQTNNSSARK